jgi:hypothetical protein
MDFWLKFLLVWFILSTVAAPLIGRCIRFGTGSDEETEAQDAHGQ